MAHLPLVTGRLLPVLTRDEPHGDRYAAGESSLFEILRIEDVRNVGRRFVLVVVVLLPAEGPAAGLGFVPLEEFRVRRQELAVDPRIDLLAQEAGMTIAKNGVHATTMP
jgi:hypothetical protein